MTARFGWCTTGHHNACRITVSNDRGGSFCGCPCHVESPLKQGESGRIGVAKREPDRANESDSLATVSTLPKGA